jgi:carboxypeptidase family protein
METGSGPGVAAVCNPPGLARCGARRRRSLPQFGGVLCVSACVLVLFAPGLAAKKKKPVTKTIGGVVLDGADNPIVGAAVELTDVTAGKKLAKYSQQAGKYEFADLDPKHDYEVQASFRGMSSEVRKVSSLDDRSVVVVNFTLTSQP